MFRQCFPLIFCLYFTEPCVKSFDISTSNKELYFLLPHLWNGKVVCQSFFVKKFLLKEVSLFGEVLAK